MKRRVNLLRKLELRSRKSRGYMGLYRLLRKYHRFKIKD